MDAAGSAGQLLQVRQFSLVHPFLHEMWVHPVEAENDELLMELLWRAPAPARDCRAERDDKQSRQNRFHNVSGMQNYNIRG